jgi:Right handed beta helix region
MAYPTEVDAVAVAPSGATALGSGSPTHTASHDQYRSALLSVKAKINSSLALYSVNGLATGSGNAGANTTLIQAALDAAEASGIGGIVFIPTGTWYINNTLNIGSRVVVAGMGWGSRLILANGTASAASPKPMLKAKTATNYITIQDLYLDGNSANQTDTNNASHGIDFGRGTTEGSGPPVYDGGLMVSNVLAYNCQGYGFNLGGGATTMRAYGCYAYHNTSNGFFMKTDCTIDGCVAGNNSGHGFEWYAATSVYARGCKAFGGQTGYKVGYSKIIAFANCQAEDTQLSGWTITSSSHVNLDNCQVYRSTGSDSERSAYWIEDDGASNLCNHITLRGCTHLSADFGTNFRYGLWTRNLGICCDFDIHTEGHSVAVWRQSTGAQICKLVVNGVERQMVNAQTGTTYTPVLTDINNLVTLSNASAITVTLPQDSALDVPVGTHIDFCQIAAGQASFTNGTGATVNGTPGLKIAAQWGMASAYKRAANTWVVTGALSA